MRDCLAFSISRYSRRPLGGARFDLKNIGIALRRAKRLQQMSALVQLFVMLSEVEASLI